jgi:hypothetical protein
LWYLHPMFLGVAMFNVTGCWEMQSGSDSNSEYWNNIVEPSKQSQTWCPKSC